MAYAPFICFHFLLFHIFQIFHGKSELLFQRNKSSEKLIGRVKLVGKDLFAVISLHFCHEI